MAGTLAQIARHTLRGELRRFDPHSARLILVEGGERVLPAFVPSLSARVQRQLERLGVTVWRRSRVSGINAQGVLLDGERIRARTVIRAAGVAAFPPSHSLGVPLDRAGRVTVAPT